MSKEFKQLELEKFLEVVSNTNSKRDTLILKILFETGCSLQDLCSIKSKDIQQLDNHFDMHKIKFKDRFSAISEETSTELKQFVLKINREPNEYIFSQKPQKPFSVKRVEQIINSISQENNLAIKPLSLRYLHIKHAINVGLSIDSIGLQTGLSKQRIIQIMDSMKLSYKQSYSTFFQYGGTK